MTHILSFIVCLKKYLHHPLKTTAYPTDYQKKYAAIYHSSSQLAPPKIASTKDSKRKPTNEDNYDDKLIKLLQKISLYVGKTTSVLPKESESTKIPTLEFERKYLSHLHNEMMKLKNIRIKVNKHTKKLSKRSETLIRKSFYMTHQIIFQSLELHVINIRHTVTNEVLGAISQLSELCDLHKKFIYFIEGNGKLLDLIGSLKAQCQIVLDLRVKDKSSDSHKQDSTRELTTSLDSTEPSYMLQIKDDEKERNGTILTWIKDTEVDIAASENKVEFVNYLPDNYIETAAEQSSKHVNVINSLPKSKEIIKSINSTYVYGEKILSDDCLVNLLYAGLKTFQSQNKRLSTAQILSFYTIFDISKPPNFGRSILKPLPQKMLELILKQRRCFHNIIGKDNMYTKINSILKMTGDRLFENLLLDVIRESELVIGKIALGLFKSEFVV